MKHLHASNNVINFVSDKMKGLIYALSILSTSYVIEHTWRQVQLLFICSITTYIDFDTDVTTQTLAQRVAFNIANGSTFYDRILYGYAYFPIRAHCAKSLEMESRKVKCVRLSSSGLIQIYSFSL